jgi:hypothetical protein
MEIWDFWLPQNWRQGLGTLGINLAFETGFGRF